MSNLIHWWELPNECPIKIDKSYLESIIKKCSNNPLIKRRTLQNIKYGIKNPRIKTVKTLLKSLKISFKEIENKISHIQTHRRLIPTRFPLKESPLHAQILAHGIFDGSKEKKGGIRYKVRYDVPTKEIFRKLLVDSFGESCYGHTDSCYFLYKSFSELLSNHYEVKEFNSKKAFFSHKLIKLSKIREYRRAILRAAFIDEGYCKHNKKSKNHEKFRLTLVSGIKNQKLASQLLKLTNIERYKTSVYAARNNSEFTIPILTESKEDFYNHIIKDLPKDHRKRKEAESALSKTF